MAIPTYKDIVDLMKKGATVEAQEKIMALREAALELQEENLSLKDAVRSLEEQVKLKTKLTFDGQVYWLIDGDQKDGPFCQRCYDAEHLLMRLQKGDIDDIDQDRGVVIKTGRYYFRCLKCSSAYEPRA